MSPQPLWLHTGNLAVAHVSKALRANCARPGLRRALPQKLHGMAQQLSRPRLATVVEENQESMLPPDVRPSPLSRVARAAWSGLLCTQQRISQTAHSCGCARLIDSAALTRRRMSCTASHCRAIDFGRF